VETEYRIRSAHVRFPLRSSVECDEPPHCYRRSKCAFRTSCLALQGYHLLYKPVNAGFTRRRSSANPTDGPQRAGGGSKSRSLNVTPHIAQNTSNRHSAGSFPSDPFRGQTESV